MTTLGRNSLTVSFLLAFAIVGCSRALAPTGSTRDVSTSFGSAPLPEPDSPTPSPCPSARFNPPPNHLLPPTLPPTFTFHWSPDVPVPGGPVPTRYRYKVFYEGGPDFNFTQLLVDPQSMLRYYAPGFAGWTEVDASVTQATLHDLNLAPAHVLVLIAMDDHGRFDNVLSYDKNMFYFHLEPGLVVDKNNDGTR
jgi:hypothetical protein